MASPSSSSQPLLPTENTHSLPPSSHHTKVAYYKRAHNVCRQQIKTFLASRAQHYIVLGLVSFDLLSIFADIIINLYQCDEVDTDPKWDDVRNGLGIAGLVFSSMFMLELLLSVWAFGFRCACPPSPSPSPSRFCPTT